MEIDLREATDSQIDQLCAASCLAACPFKDMLQDPPGVLESRVAHFTGERL